MERLDRLAWTHAVAFESYGLRFGVRTNQAGLLDMLADRFPPGWRPSPSPIVDWLFSLWMGGEPTGSVRRFNLLYAGVRVRARAHDPAVVVDGLEADLRQAVAARARRHVFVHAGVVAWGDQAILLPGRSFSGKTTLVRELVRAGAVYYSDEFAVVDASGRVHPFAKPLSIREGNGVRRCAVEEIGGVSGGRPLRVAAVIFTEHRAGARWRPVRQTAAAGLLSLLRHAVPVRRRPKATLAALEKLVSGAAIWTGPRGEAAATARAVLARVDADERVARAG
jgi:hypothetical protein